MADRIDTLRNELTNDPLVRGYSGMSDPAAAVDLNVVYRTLPVESVSGSAVFNATDADEFAALTAEQKSRWLALCAVDEIDISGGVSKAIEAELFGAGKKTRTTLQAMKTQAVSRGVELGLGFVGHADAEDARRAK